MENMEQSAKCEEEQFEKENGILDMDTPLYQELRGIYKRSFAYHTLHERLPNTLANLLDTLKLEERKEAESADWKFVEGSILELKQKLTTNAPLELFTGNEADKDLWNEFICQLPADMSTFYSTTWLFAECYVYRKLASFFQATNNLQHYDYFSEQKFNNLLLASNEMEQLAHLIQNSECNLNTFEDLLKLCLWSNRCDLSITSGKAVQPNGNMLQSLHVLNANILVDETALIWNHLIDEDEDGDIEQNNESRIIDFVCDNAAFELFTDLLLAQYLIDHQLTQIVRFHIKAIPWFISDTTLNDIHTLLNYLEKHSNCLLNTLSSLWQNYLAEGKFVIAPMEHFWTSPYEFHRMSEIQPRLYEELQKATLIIFKGDLNYRKLLGDYNWNSTDDFSTALRGFHPSNLCTLRTVKGDLICGLPVGLAEQLTKNQTNWMFTGQYAVIQYAPKCKANN